jgi:beta-1,4-mannosyl-glycoprotein beta-1,4-N-acetylglucosaminyltransferase
MIIDCFPFFKELDVLEIRLNTLDPYVDKFLLIESEETFTGIDKPLYFFENYERFGKFKDKIEYLKIPKIPENLDPNKGQVNWSREYYQKNYMMHRINELHDDDIIILSDCDEIPDLSNIDLKQIDEPKVFINKMFIFKFNLMMFNNLSTQSRVEGKPPVNTSNGEPYAWFGSSVMKQKHLKNKMFWNVDGLRAKRCNFEQINGGWHFTFCMDNKDVQHKLKAFSHADELDNSKINNSEYINKCIVDQKEFNDCGRDVKLIDIDCKYLPKYLVENKEKYNHLFK